MQIQQTSLISVNNDLAPPSINSSSIKQENRNNTVANISRLAAGLTVFSIGSSYVLESALKFGFGCSARNFENQINCLDLVWHDAMKYMIVTAALSLTASFAAGKVTESSIQALESALQAFRDFRAGTSKQSTIPMPRKFRDFV